MWPARPQGLNSGASTLNELELNLNLLVSGFIFRLKEGVNSGAATFRRGVESDLGGNAKFSCEAGGSFARKLETRRVVPAARGSNMLRPNEKLELANAPRGSNSFACT